MTQAGIELATFRFVAQHLNHCDTACFQSAFSYFKKFSESKVLAYFNAWY